MAKNEELSQIIAGCKAGKSESFSQLLDLYAKRCYGYFYRLTGNRDVSDDLLSELFVKLVKNISSFKNGSFDSWIFRIASNVFYDYLRTRQRQKKILDVKRSLEETKVSADPGGNYDRDDELQKQLGKLDEKTRELIMLRFYSGATFRELAAMRNEPIGSILSKVHRGLKKLKELMET
ncbi:RNA polymerase sigma factor [Planctomycetota bacterium]